MALSKKERILRFLFFKSFSSATAMTNKYTAKFKIHNMHQCLQFIFFYFRFRNTSDVDLVFSVLLKRKHFTGLRFVYFIIFDLVFMLII